eukprot:2115738-Pyramimonas_sp.AAC.1
MRAVFSTGRNERGLRPRYNPFTDNCDRCDESPPSTMPSKWVTDASSAACVNRPASKAEAANDEGAAAALKQELGRLREIKAWGESKVVELSRLRKMIGGRYLPH